MAEAKWLDGYSGQSVDELLALASDYRIDSLVLAFEQGLLQKADWNNPAAALNEAELAVVAIESLEREVNNGGYHQFFLNTPQFAPFVAAALERVGCTKTAQISRRAAALLGLKEKFTAAEVEGALARDAQGKLAETLNAECDGAYQDSGESIADRLFEYIRANRAAIRLP